MQFHGGSVREFEENGTVKALLEMREQGLVKWVGASTNLPHLPTLIDWGVFDIFQLPYSALDRTHEEWITKAAESGAGVLIRGGVALGEPRRRQGKPLGMAGFRGRGPRRAAGGGREPHGVSYFASWRITLSPTATSWAPRIPLTCGRTSRP